MFKLPKHIPSVRLMIGDIPLPDAQLAAHLGITLPTLRRYARQDKAPRAVCLALFWITRWGASTIDCETANALMWQRGLADSLSRENAELRAYVAELECPSKRRAANAGRFAPETPKRRHRANCNGNEIIQGLTWGLSPHTPTPPFRHKVSTLGAP